MDKLHLEANESTLEFNALKLNREDLVEAFQRDGFAVIRNAIPGHLCSQTFAAFDLEIKPSKYHFRRQTSGFQPHIFTPFGYMRDALMSIQDLPIKQFPYFKNQLLSTVTAASIQDIVMDLIGEPGRIIYTMCFEGNQQTHAHRDSHTIDAEQIGQMVGVWIAAEDIHPGAGRFYVVEGSHKAVSPPELGLDQLHPNSPEYKQQMATWVQTCGLPVVAPVLNQGDILLFHSLTVHGSLPTSNPERSRKSITCHYIPLSQQPIWFRSTRSECEEIEVNGVPIALHGYRPITPITASQRRLQATLDSQLGIARRFVAHRVPGLYRIAKVVASNLKGNPL
ncbi:MAG: phytanoyl-CoA dioxygenase family protein [Prochlorococcaceae cyanobacterium]